MVSNQDVSCMLSLIFWYLFHYVMLNGWKYFSISKIFVNSLWKLAFSPYAKVSKWNTYFNVENKNRTNSNRERSRNSIKTQITFSHQCCTHTHAYSICLRRSSFKYLANSQMASPAFYSLLSSSIELWARVRNYMQLNKEWSIVSDLYCKKCNHSLASLSPLSSTPTPSALRNYTSKY